MIVNGKEGVKIKMPVQAAMVGTGMVSMELFEEDVANLLKATDAQIRTLLESRLTRYYPNAD